MIRRLTWAVALALLPLATSFSFAAADSSTPSGANVIASDYGFSPASVSIPVGGWVTWTNHATRTHTATSLPGNSIGFDTGGLGNGQSATVTFDAAGAYTYTSFTDCLGSNFGPGFNCDATYRVVVGAPAAAPSPAPSASAAAVASPAPAASASPAPAAAGQSAGMAAGPRPTVTVYLSDGTFSPASVTVPSGGTVSWINSGVNIHSAASLVGAPLQFNTGGIPNNNAAASFTFFVPGAYNYTSGIDCLLPGGGMLQSFSCGVPYSVVVTGPPAAPIAATNTTISIDDQTGFGPANLAIRAGQTVTWVNHGTNVHSVTSNPGVIPAFDSGGLGPGQSFSHTFSQPALLGYHSSTEAVYTNNFGYAPTIVSYKFNGTVSAQ